MSVSWLTAGSDIFKRYKGDRKIYIETGSYEGDSAQVALDSGFDRVYMIEADYLLYRHCRHRFKDDTRVICIHGASPGALQGVLDAIFEPALIFLDAHLSYGIDPLKLNTQPLLAELDLLKDGASKDHLILIDDVCLMGVYIAAESEVLSRVNGYDVSYTFGAMENSVIVLTPIVTQP